MNVYLPGHVDPKKLPEKIDMTTSQEIEAQILRYHHVEKWRIGTITRHLHIHHSVVRRVLSETGVPNVAG